MKDRRKPLGGVDKDTFVKSAGDPVLNAELTYDLLAGIKSDLCHELQTANAKIDYNREVVAGKINEIKTQCECRMAECLQQNDRRYLQRFSMFGKIFPISPVGFLVIFAGFWFLVGLGILEISDVLDIKGIIRALLV